MRRVHRNLLGMLLAAACGDARSRAIIPGATAAGQASCRSSAAGRSAADAEGPVDLVSAVSLSGSGEGAVGLKFQLRQRPVAGQPVVIVLRLVANQPLEHLEARFHTDDGLDISQGGDFDPEGHMDAGSARSSTPDRGARARGRLHGDGDTDERHSGRGRQPQLRDPDRVRAGRPPGRRACSKGSLRRQVPSAKLTKTAIRSRGHDGANPIIRGCLVGTLYDKPDQRQASLRSGRDGDLCDHARAGRPDGDPGRDVGAASAAARAAARTEAALRIRHARCRRAAAGSSAATTAASMKSGAAWSARCSSWPRRRARWRSRHRSKAPIICRSSSTTSRMWC
jgi:hypothetical protein